jgi:uncharacterized protein YlxW (UPF0749 family)
MSQQVVKLKRTAVEGKVPTTSNIELGELAINTFDGRIFFEKDNGTPSIQQVVTTNSQTTGSLNILGDVTASFFIGNGSQLTNLPNSEISQVATVTASFQDTSSISVNHNFNSRNVIVSVYDNSYSQLIPTSVVLTDNNNLNVTLSGPQSGFAVVAKGGHIVSGTLVQEISEVSTVTASFDNESTIVVTHSFESKNIIVSVYDSNDSQIIPQSVTLTDLNTTTIVLSANHSGFVVVAKGGHFVTGSATTSYTNLTNIPIGIVSGSSQLTSSLDLRYALSGSVGGSGTSDFTQLINVPSGLVSGSTQVVSILNSLNTYTASQSTSSLATTGSNTFVGTQTFSGSLIPATDNTYDLGSPTKQFRDLYLSSASLYIDGTKVLGSTAQELTITTDEGQSIKILEAGSDSIILQSADGDIELKSSGGGDILLDPTAGLISVKGTLQIQDGNRITSSGGNSIQFGNNIGITGSLSTSGDINGINLTSFSSSLSTQIKSIQSSTSSTEERWTMFFSYTSSNDTTNTTQNSRLSSLESVTGSYEIKGRGIVSGSSQIVDVLSSLNTYTSSNDTTNTAQNGRLTSLETKSGSVDSSITSINSFTSSNGNTSLNEYTSSLKTAISVSGQNVTVNGNFTVAGTQTIVDSTTVQIGDNIIELNGSGATNGGLLVKDPTAPNTVSGSLLWDSTNDYWKGGALGSESKLLVAGGDGVVSGSSQVVGILSSLNTYTGSNDTTNTTQNSRLTSLETKTGSLDSDNNVQNSRLTSIESATGSYETKGRGIVSGSSQVVYTSLSSIPTGIVSGSSQVVSILSSLNTYTGSNDTTNTAQNSRLTSIESATGSYETKGRGLVSGSSQVTPLLPTGTVSGSSQITISSTTGYGSVLNQAVLTSSSPTFAGLTINGKVTATSTGVDGTFADAFVSQYSSNNSETNAIQTSVSSAANVSGFRFQVSNGGGSSARTTVVDFLRDRAIFNTSIGIGTSSPRTAATGGNKTLDIKGGIYFGSTNSESTCINNDDSFIINFDSNNDGGTANFLRIAKGTTGETGGTELLRVNGSGHVLPGANGTQDLGSTSLRWGTVYTSDLSLNNGIGDWTIVEGEDDLFLYNNKKGKVYKFALTEVDPNVATPKKS